MSEIGERILRQLETVEAAYVGVEPCYRVWRFHDAPDELRALSRHGGDEDWVCHCPAGSDSEPSWAMSGSFGPCEVSSHELADGSTVLIGAHA